MKRRTADVTVFFFSLCSTGGGCAILNGPSPDFHTHSSTSNTICGLRAVPVPIEENDNALVEFFFRLLLFCDIGVDGVGRGTPLHSFTTLSFV